MSNNINVEKDSTRSLRSEDADRCDATAAVANERCQPVKHRNSNEALTNLIAPAGSVIRRVAASPRQVKTQIAKVSYSAHRPLKVKQRNKKASSRQMKNMLIESSTSTPNKIELIKEEFHQKKGERDKEVQELKNVFGEITKKPKGQKTEMKPMAQDKAHSDNIEIVVPLRRSKTEILDENVKTQGRRRGGLRSVRTEKRSKSSQLPNTSQEILPAGSGSRRKAYNVEDARKFIEEQKRRRRLQQAKASLNAQRNKTVLEKEQIKKRLEELRKNSRAIVSKNLTKKNSARSSNIGGSVLPKASICDTQENINSAKSYNQNECINKIDDCASSADEKNRNDMTIEIFVRKPKSDSSEKEVHQIGDKIIRDVTQIGNDILEDNSNLENNTKPLQTDTVSCAEQRDTKTNASTNEIPNQKRVGLLRKLEIKDHSFSAIKEFSFDKENVALNMMTPKVLLSNERPVGDKILQSKTNNEGGSELSQSVKSNNNLKSNEPSIAPVSVPKFEVKRSKITQEVDTNSKKQQQSWVKDNDTNETKECTDLPYWLKPSAVQIYPYNFIMAVRRKLEAITDTKPQHKGTHDQLNTSLEDYSFSSCTNKDTVKSGKLSKKSSMRGHEAVTSEECFVTHTIRTKKNIKQKLVDSAKTTVDEHKSQTLSDLNTNITSISIDLQESKTASEITSLKIGDAPKSNAESQNVAQSGDETTISSSIFNSPVKNKHRKQINSRDNLDNISPLSLEPVQYLRLTSNHQLKEAIASNYVNSERGDETYKIKQSDPKDRTQICHERNKIDFNQLLDDFNHSLSQVIQVNDQLKTTLNKSHQIYNIEHKSASTKQSDEYTSDFEENSSQSSYVKTGENRRDKGNKTYLKQQIKTLNDPKITKPLYFQYEIDTNIGPAHKRLTPILDIELESGANSGDSKNTRSHSTTNNSSANKQLPNSSEDSERHLNANENVKENFKQASFNSQKNSKFIEGKITVANMANKETVETRLENLKTIKNTPRHTQSMSSNISEVSKRKDPHVGPTENLTHSEELASTSMKSKIVKSTSLTSKSERSASSNKRSETSKSIVEDLQYEDINNENRQLSEQSLHQKSVLKSTRNRKTMSDRTINKLRGDFLPPHNTYSTEKDVIILDGNVVHQQHTKSSHMANEFTDLLNQSGLNLSTVSPHNESISESSCSYSSVGLYEKLIRNETTKSEQLTVLLKMREKALFDRTKGQIAWLEVQKERCKSKGLLEQIATIRKKQRGILIKMEKEREEIKRLLQSATTTTTTESSATYQPHEVSHSQNVQTSTTIAVVTSKGIKNNCPNEQSQLSRKSPKLVTSVPVFVSKLSKSARTASCYHRNIETTRSVPIIRANYELESSRSLEELLLKRETDLRTRREHVERLMQWHRRLDEEEADVLEMEHALLNYNYTSEDKGLGIIIHEQKRSCNPEYCREVSLSPKNLSRKHAKMERRLKEIDKSLRELNSISSTNSTAISNAESSEEVLETIDFVRATGTKLNKLWRRLTSQQIEKFEPDRQYKLCKTDLEQLYEEAKSAVLHDFAQNEGKLTSELLEESVSNLSNNSPCVEIASLTVPHLNLNLSSEHEDESLGETSSCSPALGKYSPSTAEEDFNVCSNPKISLVTTHHFVKSSEEKPKHESELPNATLKKVVKSDIIPLYSYSHSERNLGLLRSLSDTQISKLRQNIHLTSSAATSSRYIVAFEGCQRNELEISNKTKVNENAIESQITSGTSSIESSAGTFQAGINTATTLISSAEVSDDLVEQSNSPQQALEINDKEASVSYTGESDEEFDVTKSAVDSTESIPENPPEKELPETNVYKSSHEDRLIFCKTSSRAESKLIYKDTTELNECKNVPEKFLERDENNGDSYSDHFEDTTDLQSSSELESNKDPDQILDIGCSKSSITDSGSNLEKDEISGTKNGVMLTNEQDIDCTSDETRIDDITPPDLETNVNTTQEDINGTPLYEEVQRHLLQKSDNLTEDLEESPSALTLQPPQVNQSHNQTNAAIINSSTSSTTAQLMPDIINEVEFRRCHQNLIENEHLKQFEHVTSIPYMYVREIPNKPPPPYVPPAHGSPMTTIFPSEERIKDITHRRTHELYCELLKTDYVNEKGEKLPSVMDEKITNIYERIILDICREYLDEHHEVLTQGDPVNFHSPLAFFNPPDRLRCIQRTIYKEIRRCLAMDKTPPKRTQVYSVYGQRAKRDHIGKVIIQEMYDEDDKWCNFHREENEVLELIVDEMISKCIIDITTNVLLEEGGSIEAEEQDKGNAADLNIDEGNNDTDDMIGTTQTAET